MSLLFHIGFLEIRFIDILDILLVSILLYQLYKLLKGSVAVKIFLGLMSIYLFYLLVNASGMHLLSDILGQFIGVGVLAAIILFQQEIRRFLLLVGKSTSVNNERIYKFLHLGKNQDDKVDFNHILDAVDELSKTQTGALIALTQDSDLKEYADTGDHLNANLSMRLLLSIFNKHSPMHDGAVIISGNTVVAARCLVPVSDRGDIPAKYGMRHRAGLGLSEVTDSFVIIVSEESGEISMTYQGKMKAGLDKAALRRNLNRVFQPVKKGKRKKATS